MKHHIPCTQHTLPEHSTILSYSNATPNTAVQSKNRRGKLQRWDKEKEEDDKENVDKEDRRRHRRKEETQGTHNPVCDQYANSDRTEVAGVRLRQNVVGKHVSWEHQR